MFLNSCILFVRGVDMECKIKEYENKYSTWKTMECVCDE